LFIFYCLLPGLWEIKDYSYSEESETSLMLSF